MPTIEEVQTWRGHDVKGPDGQKVGSVEDVYLDRETDQPEWIAVKTGMFGSRVSFVPVADAQMSADEVTVPYEKAFIKDAPHAEPDGELSTEEEQRLYAYYQRDYAAPEPAGTESFGGAPPVGDDTSGPETDNAMTRSEEELHVGTAQREVGKARLRKHIVTEQVQTTVPVQHEEVRIEREPITDANAGAALDGPALSEEEHEVTLHAEEPVVEKRVVPKERVRLSTDTVTEEQSVSEDVHKEQIDTDGSAR